MYVHTSTSYTPRLPVAMLRCVLLNGIPACGGCAARLLHFFLFFSVAAVCTPYASRSGEKNGSST